MTRIVLMEIVQSVQTNVWNAVKILLFAQNAEVTVLEPTVHVLKECMMMEPQNFVNLALMDVLSAQVHQELVLLA